VNPLPIIMPDLASRRKVYVAGRAIMLVYP